MMYEPEATLNDILEEIREFRAALLSVLKALAPRVTCLRCRRVLSTAEDGHQRISDGDGSMFWLCRDCASPPPGVQAA